MKSYTDIEQSRKLKKILPIESADMLYVYDRHLNKLYEDTPYVIGYKVLNENVDIPCWSLATLLDVLPNSLGRYTKSLYWFDDAWHCEYVDENSESKIGTSAGNPIDACYKIILKLYELNLL